MPAGEYWLVQHDMGTFAAGLLQYFPAGQMALALELGTQYVPALPPPQQTAEPPGVVYWLYYGKLRGALRCTLRACR